MFVHPLEGEGFSIRSLKPENQQLIEMGSNKLTKSPHNIGRLATWGTLSDMLPSALVARIHIREVYSNDSYSYCSIALALKCFGLMAEVGHNSVNLRCHLRRHDLYFRTDLEVRNRATAY